MRKKILIIAVVAIATAGLASFLGVFFFHVTSIDLQLSLLEKKYRPGEKIHLSAAVSTKSVRAIKALVNARIVGKDTDRILQAYFPTLKKYQEYTFSFDMLPQPPLAPGKYRFMVSVMVLSGGDSLDDVVHSERSFKVARPRKLTAKEIATRKARKEGKGLPIDADLVLYPLEADGSFYNRTVPLMGMFRNVSYWDGDFKLSMVLAGPKGKERVFSELFRVPAGAREEFSFDIAISSDMAEGRYTVAVRLFDDRKDKKGYGKMLNEVVISIAVVDRKPRLNLDEIALSIPAKDTYEFRVRATDDRGIGTVIFHHEIENKNILTRTITLKKKIESKEMNMTLISGDHLSGIWVNPQMMPSKGTKFLFWIEARDTLGQSIITERYPVSVTEEDKVKKKALKALKKKKKEKKMKDLPGFQGYDQFGY